MQNIFYEHALPSPDFDNALEYIQKMNPAAKQVGLV